MRYEESSGHCARIIGVRIGRVFLDANGAPTDGARAQSLSAAARGVELLGCRRLYPG
jgi:hypothetical protein